VSKPSVVSNGVLTVIYRYALIAGRVDFVPARVRPDHHLTFSRSQDAQARHNIYIQWEGSRCLLRFDSRIVNVGTGPFEAPRRGAGFITATRTATKQRICDDAGGHRDVATPGAETYWSGDELTTGTCGTRKVRFRQDSDGIKVGTGAKVGFSLWENNNYNTGHLSAEVPGLQPIVGILRARDYGSVAH
jgi:hypothetical protein